MDKKSVLRFDELDTGFILRANEEVTQALRSYIKQSKQGQNMEILVLNPDRKVYG